MKKYIPSEIEPKWQQKWKEDKLYQVDLTKAEKRQYILIEFSYPSGDLHMGHWFAFAVPDILVRLRRMQGYNVFFPNGFDAFGLPAENAAIKKGVHPKDWTLANIEKMKQQFSTMGASFNWENEVITCLPEYYKWNQWIFLKMMEKGIAYKGKALANWCPNCQTVLANENVEAGKCWRCGTEVIQKSVSQWFLKLTAYADKLLWPASPAKRGEDNPLSNGVDWPIPVKVGQNNWIGKREGTSIIFDIPNTKHQIEVFTTRGDTLFGATFLVIAPEHPLVEGINDPEVKKYVEAAKKKSPLERLMEQKDKTGVSTGIKAINPINGEEIPVWISDYAVMGFGTGALFGDAHDERDVVFAKKYGIPLKPTLVTGDKERDAHILNLEEVFTGDGTLVDSGQFTGLTSKEARVKVAQWLSDHKKGGRKLTYHIHDWSVSRQRYWGTPIPVIYCEDCGTVPVPEKDLPVELPYEVDYAPKGKPPLATAEEWVSVACPKCTKAARREVETMDTFFDSSWYFFRYLDPKNDKEPFGREVTDKWLPLDIYFGGAEHTLGHTLYSRFFTKFFKDIGITSIDEYAKKRVNRGLILGSDGQKMSKSRGNVVNPDEQVKSYGADAVRLYLAFIGPYAETVAPWDNAGLNGVYHFLQRIWSLQEKVTSITSHPALDAGSINIDSGSSAGMTVVDHKMLHKTIKRVTEDIEASKFNTAIAGLMEYLNYVSKKAEVTKEEYKTFILILAPFVPHITEELWSILGEKYSIHKQSLPEFDSKYLVEEQVAVVVQINGKVRDTLMIQKDILSNEEDIEKLAKSSEKIQKYLEGKSVKKVVYVKGRVINFVI